ncbi:LysM peptidoglycan-binding domain-containing protein [Treponema sp. OMZ 305]|uniref:Hsp70 family protein n=1 Tax=Treponema TaxID=157 RepID=UPI001BAF5792|nr:MULTISPECIES: Hsp70 family protein [Treponema]QUY17079.1 LysM peptidoglycan-binding domain-containing protein [Treponema vincentii]UTC56912.1 LysM peptidoglycan-binding domain-containing protein [Treponema sp. OMZ 305]
MAAKIGIKLADGTFFPIMDDDASASETLELTTVRDNQRSVQINLFKKEDDASDPLYIGSLIVEDIHEKAAGEPTIELQLVLDEDKNLSAEAVDKDSGSHQTLRVSLETFADQAFDDVDFDLSAETADADIDLSTANINTDDNSEPHDEFSAAAFYTDEDGEKEHEPKRGMPVWLLILLILLGIAALVLGILLLTKKNLAEDDHPMVVQPEATTVIPSKKPPMQESAAPAPSLPADKSVTEPPAPQPTGPAPIEQPVPSQPVQQDAMAPQEPAKQEPPVQQTEPAASVLAQKTIRYKLRWGDTLWDLSETYYRNPWLYTKIAKHNKLKNPDLIISGTYIEIPPQ